MPALARSATSSTGSSRASARGATDPASPKSAHLRRHRVRHPNSCFLPLQQRNSESPRPDPTIAGGFDRSWRELSNSRRGPSLRSLPRDSPSRLLCNPFALRRCHRATAQLWPGQPCPTAKQRPAPCPFRLLPFRAPERNSRRGLTKRDHFEDLAWPLSAFQRVSASRFRELRESLRGWPADRERAPATCGNPNFAGRGLLPAGTPPQPVTIAAA